MANEYNQTQQIPRHVQSGQQPYQQQYPPRQMILQRGATTTGQWVLTLFLVSIPIVNIILMLVWAFGSNTEPSKQNWARANLIWIIIGIAIIVVFSVIATMMGVDLAAVYRNPA